MAFFRKLFRSRTEDAPATPATVSDDMGASPVQVHDQPAIDETATPDQPPTSDSELLLPIEPPVPDQIDDATELLARALEGPVEDTPWWEDSAAVANDASAPPTEGETLANPDESIDVVMTLDEPLPETETAISSDGILADSSPLHQDLIVTQPVAAIVTNRIERDSTRELGAAAESVPILNPAVQGLAAAALRDIGRVRQINQDSVFSMLATLPREGVDLPMGLFVLADGMGGHEGGEVASRLAVSSVVRYVLGKILLPALADAADEAIQPIMIDAIKEANRAIWDHAQRVGSDMGTTCTAVLLLGSALYISHIGDSRAYILDSDELQLLTEDHSAVGRLIQLGQLAPSEAREHPLRSQLYRTVGQHPQIQVDFTYQRIGEGTHLLMGSDGLWGLLNEERMAQTLQTYLWPQDACRELVSLANLAGGDDNISVIVVSFHVAERLTA